MGRTGAENARPVLEKGSWQGLEAENARPVLEKGLWQGLEEEIERPGLEIGVWQGLEARTGGRDWRQGLGRWAYNDVEGAVGHPLPCSYIYLYILFALCPS